MLELVQLLRSRKIPKADRAQIAQCQAGREAISGEQGNRLRNQHLTTVSGAHDPSGAIHLTAEEILVAMLVKAHMQTAASPKRKPLLRFDVAQIELELDDGRDGVQRIVEHCIQPVTGRFDECPTMVRYRLPTHRVMGLERESHPLGMLFPESSTIFDVGKQERRDRRRGTHVYSLGGRS
jgi:hypothetical protein